MNKKARKEEGLYSKEIDPYVIISGQKPSISKMTVLPLLVHTSKVSIS